MSQYQEEHTVFCSCTRKIEQCSYGYVTESYTKISALPLPKNLGDFE